MAAATMTADYTLRLSETERTHLLTFLEQGLRDKLIEEHRTEAPDFREHVHSQEAAMESLIAKLRRL